MGTTVPLQIKLTSQRLMVSTRNTSRSNVNPPRMQDQPGGVDNRPPEGALKIVQTNTDEVEALRLTNQHLLKELEQLTKQIRRPQETRQARKDQNPVTREEQFHDPHREADREGETSHIMEHDLYQPPEEDRNEERSWEQRFRDIQQEISHMKVAIKGRAPVSMDALVQQIESPFTAGVLHFPLSTKFRIPQIETFDGTKDPINHLNMYKNQMELHGYQDPVRCRAFAITLKGPALARFNRLPPSSISSFTEFSIAFVSHFIGARTYRKPSYHLLTIKQSSQESMRSYVQRFNTESLKVDILDEKFVVIAFIAGLGVQSKDIMFSISKNPQVSMAEVLAKTEKYINGEEALLSKQRSSLTQKEKSRGDKKKRTKSQETGRQGQIPKEEQRKQRTVPDKTRERQRS